MEQQQTSACLDLYLINEENEMKRLFAKKENIPYYWLVFSQIMSLQPPETIAESLLEVREVNR